MYARAKMPLGHREKSFFSIDAHSTSLTLFCAAICSRDTPRLILARRRFGPKASLPLMAGGRVRKTASSGIARGCAGNPAPAIDRVPFFYIAITKLARSVELAARRRLLAADASGDDLGARVVL